MRLLTVLLVAVALVGCQTLVEGGPAGSIDAFEVVALLGRGEAIIVDTRSAAEKKLGGPRGAVDIQFGPDDFLSRPASADERESFANKIRAADVGSKKIFLLCQYGVRSGEAQKALAEHGIASASIAGGWLGKGHLVGLKDWLQ